METPVLLVAALLVLLVVGLLVLVLRDRSRSRRELALSRAETAELRSRLEELTHRLEDTSAALVETREAAYLITDAGAERPEPTVPDRVVLSATHGVARALSPESRNRIWFAMRREVRRARKERRRDLKDALRQVRADRAAGGEAAPAA